MPSARPGSGAARRSALLAGRAVAAAIAALSLSFLLLALPRSAGAAGASTPRVGGRLEAYGVARFDNSSPSQAPQARLDLWAEQRLSKRLRWRFSTIGLWGGPPRGASAGVFNVDETFQNFSPSLELDDAYLNYIGDAIDLRVGKQKLFWGRLDGIQPNDLLNPRQYEDPLLTDEKDAKLAVPALAVTYLFPAAWRSRLPEESRLTVVWEPIDVPWRFPLTRERWFAPAARPAPSLQAGALPDTPCPCDVTVTQQVQNSPAPGRTIGKGNLGIRLSGRSGEADWAVVFFEGFDPTPNFSVPIRVVPSPTQSRPGVLEATAETRLRPAYRRFQSLGADGAMPIGAFTARAEAAWRFRRPYAIPVDQLTSRILADPSLVRRLAAGETVELPAFAERDAVEWGAGVDTIVEGFVPLLELYQVIVLHNDQRLLIRDVDTRLTLNLRRRWMADRLESQLLGAWGIESGYELLRAQLTYDILDGLQAVAGVLGVWGARNSLVGQYKRNSEAFARLRYTF